MTEAAERCAFNPLQMRGAAEFIPAASGNYFTAALIFSAASGETHFDQVASLFLRKYLAPSSPVAWLSTIQARSLLASSVEICRFFR
jgi:hypothetical protein